MIVSLFFPEVADPGQNTWQDRSQPLLLLPLGYKAGFGAGERIKTEMALLKWYDNIS